MANRRTTSCLTLHRFFLPAGNFEGDRVEFTAQAARQIERVLRLRTGRRVIALDGTGMEYIVRLETRDGVTGTVEESRRNQAEPTARITLYQGLLKGSKMETVFQKGTELGVSEFVPVETARAIPRDRAESRHDRYQTIVREAAEQSGRGSLPTILKSMSFREAIVHGSDADASLFVWEKAEARTIRDALDRYGVLKINLFVGPEGGFSDEEALEARASGAYDVTLGRRTLRSETAAIVTVALVLQALGEM